MPSKHRDPSGLKTNHEPWYNSSEFFWWYYFGLGEAVSLNDVELIESFQDAIARDMIGGLKAMVTRGMEVSCDSPIATAEGNTEIDYKIDGASWWDAMGVFGGGSVFVEYKCRKVAYCRTCCRHNPPVKLATITRCSVRVKIDDDFSNPLDKGGYYKKEEWWGATAFPITGDFTETYMWAFIHKDACP